MSKLHPIIAVTGSSGAGTTTVKEAFKQLFLRENINAALVEGDSFHRYERKPMREKIVKAQKAGKNFSHFGPEANHFDLLEKLFKEYSTKGSGKFRHYAHTYDEGQLYGVAPGTFTDWEPIVSGSDLLFYEGLHGGVVANQIDVAKHVDLLVGVVPVMNLEWIQKVQRDTKERGYDSDDVTETILRRMYDYIHYIMPQFSRTDINFQRVPVVDTANPFAATSIPSADESLVVINFANPQKFNIKFTYLLAMIKDSYMSRKNTLVVPGGKMSLAIELIFSSIVKRMMRAKHQVE